MPPSFRGTGSQSHAHPSSPPYWVHRRTTTARMNADLASWLADRELISSRKAFALLFFYISNNAGSSDGREGPMWRCPDFWRGLQTILETTGILQESVPLLIRNAKDYIASAFIGKLFTAVVFALTFCEAESSAAEDFYFRALRWVLQAVQDSQHRHTPTRRSLLFLLAYWICLRIFQCRICEDSARVRG
jgi:hypothetical protein